MTYWILLSMMLVAIVAVSIVARSNHEAPNDATPEGPVDDDDL